MPQTSIHSKTDKWLRLLAIALLVTGIALRIYIYLQNRNLIIDEANIARNIYQRGFAALLQPLDYYQYAPPSFLWITKLSSLLFGMGEMALKLYPLLCGIATLVLFYKILRQLVPLSAVWYPLSLLVFGAIFIRYSSEVKQYMPDVFVCLLLLWLALRTDINKFSTLRFVLLWMVAGSLAIWSSMPSVFILGGVGAYYLWISISTRQYSKILPLCLAGGVWIAQFLLLSEQANSEYLQNFHHYYFLFATPSKADEWQHNWHVFSMLMEQFEGHYPYVHSINTAFLISGLIMLARKATANFFLLAIPVILLAFAAAIDQYSLMPRVSLFIIPFIILIIGYGFAQFCYLKSVWLRRTLVIVALYAAGCNIAFMAERPFKYEELTEGMEWLQEKKIPPAAISVYHSSVPAFVYYTTIHPGKEQWASIKGADTLEWYVNYDSMGWHMRHVWSSRQPLGFLYTNCTEEEFKIRNDGIAKHMQLVDKLDKPYIKSYIYIKPE